jgi:hypothetical protein
MLCGGRAEGGERECAGLGVRRGDELADCFVGRCAVDDEDHRRSGQIANRLKARDRIVIRLSQNRIDDDRIRRHHDRIAVGRGARRQLVSDRSAGARVVFDDHGLVVRFADLLAQDARQNVGAAPGRERNDDPDGSAGLRPGRLNERSYARQNDGQRCQLQTFATQDFHRFTPQVQNSSPWRNLIRSGTCR